LINDCSVREGGDGDGDGDVWERRGDVSHSDARGVWAGRGSRQRGVGVGGAVRPFLGSQISEYGEAGRMGGSPEGFLGGWLAAPLSRQGSGWGVWGVCVSLCPVPQAAWPRAHIPSFRGDGRKSKPPPAAPHPVQLGLLIALRAAEMGAHALALFKGTLITLKQKTRGVHSWDPTPRIPPFPSPAALPEYVHTSYLYSLPSQ